MISMEKTKIEFTATITTPDGKVITKKVVENIPSIDEYDPSDLDKFMSSFDVYERAIKSFKLLNLSQFATRSIILL